MRKIKESRILGQKGQVQGKKKADREIKDETLIEIFSVRFFLPSLCFIFCV
jgi:hypothetical protein